MALLMKFLIPLAATALTLQQVEPDGNIGLPLAGHRPGWLARRDELVVDARSSTTGGMLILQLVLMDAGGYWGSVETRERPRWLRAILATNRHHARVHGHAMVLRWKQTLPLTEWQEQMCHKSGKDREECLKSWERENFCWEKFPFMVDYLLNSQEFTHMIMLDADAALVHHQVDILGGIAQQMQQQNVDVFLTNEDWLKNGQERINGGVIMARNSKWSEDMFQDAFEAHKLGQKMRKKWRIGETGVMCTSNEQICLNDLVYGHGKKIMEGHVAFQSGIVYNRGGCTLKHCGEKISDPSMEELNTKDPRLLIVHFMGASKGMAPQILCETSQNYTGEASEGYGCRT
eukprot:symbB.v1.2.008269.t1/scaffold518.1/size193124/10